MKNSTWSITTYSDGKAVASAEGLGHDEAVVAIRRAMYGSDPLTEDGGRERGVAPRAVKLDRRAADQQVPVAA